MTHPDLSAGDRWIASRSPDQRKKQGQWPTPWWVVQAVTERACAGLVRPVIADLACGDGRWLVAAARQCPGARLFGVDTDPTAIAAAKEVCRTAGVEATLICADGLAAVPVVPRCDLVLGNPPWVRPQNLDKAVREDLWARFDTATDKCDLYTCFVERALATAERTALVVPDTFMHLASFAALRRRLLAAGVAGVWALPKRTFASMPVPSVALFTGSDEREAGTLDPQGWVPTGTVQIAADAWSLEGPLPDLRGRPLGDYATIHMGVVCGDYDRYVHQGRRFPEDQPTCRGRDVRPWHIEDRGEFVRYDPADMLRRKPYVAPKHAGLFDVACKIVLAGTSGRVLRAAMDEQRRFPLDSCYVIHPREGVDPWGLLGLLLSPQVGAWYGARHRAARVKGVEVARIPLPPPSTWGPVAEAAYAKDIDAIEHTVEVCLSR